MLTYPKKEIKMKLHFQFLIFLIFISQITHSVDTTISMFLHKYPYFHIKQEEQMSPEELSKALKQPGYVAEQALKSKSKWSSSVAGIMCLYAGNVATSDTNGEVIFPKLQQQDNIYLLITKGVGFGPDYIIAPSTVHNWGQKKETELSLDTEKSYEIYLITFKHDDKLEISYFDTKKATFPDIEDQNSAHWRHGRYIIPLNTITIISDPSDIFVPIGATITKYSPNLTLPPLFIKRTFCFIYNSLYTLAIKQYFNQEQATHQLEGQTVSTILQRV
jgi:hypothetical protein